MTEKEEQEERLELDTMHMLLNACSLETEKLTLQQQEILSLLIERLATKLQLKTKE